MNIAVRYHVKYNVDKRRDVRDVVNAINVYISNDAMYTDVHTGWEWNMNVVSKNQELLKEAICGRRLEILIQEVWKIWTIFKIRKSGIIVKMLDIAKFEKFLSWRKKFAENVERKMWKFGELMNV